MRVLDVAATGVVSYDHLYCLERGEHMPRESVLRDLARVLRVTYRELRWGA